MTVVSRAEVLAYRAWAHGLDRRPGATDLVLGLGVQDTPYGSAALALAARGGRVEGPLVWTWRGAPHVHHPRELRALATALWPVSDADARKRITTTSIKDGAKRGLEAFTVAAQAMRDIVVSRMPKGEVSRLVTAAIPDDLSYDCSVCESRHISGLLFQQLGLFAGVQVVPEGRSTFLAPLPEGVRPPAVPRQADGTADVSRRYVELHGPASAADLASFLGTTQAVVKPLIPDDLVPVDGPAGAGWMTPDALGTFDAPRCTRLLPPSDPWLQARDREVVLPAPARRKLVWKAMANPGVVLVDGEIRGLWRSTMPRRGRLRVAVEELDPLPARVRREIEAEAELVGAARAAENVEVVLP
jgi:hypothetical protein